MEIIRKYHSPDWYNIESPDEGINQGNDSTEKENDLTLSTIVHSQILQDFIPVNKPWYFSTEIILSQVSDANVPENRNFSDDYLIHN